MLTRTSRSLLTAIIRNSLRPSKPQLSAASKPGLPLRLCFQFSETKTHEFKAETKKLLDIVAKSLYTDSEVFLR